MRPEALWRMRQARVRHERIREIRVPGAATDMFSSQHQRQQLPESCVLTYRRYILGVDSGIFVGTARLGTASAGIVC